MTLFGRTLDGAEIAQLVGLLLVLILWIAAWRGERSWERWFKGWNGDRKARREAELAAQRGDAPPPPTLDKRPPGKTRGPWG